MGMGNVMKISGMSWDDLSNFTVQIKDRNVLRDYYDGNPFLLAMYDLVKEHDIAPEDMCCTDQWGYTTDGRVVLLDAGATKEVLEQYYHL